MTTTTLEVSPAASKVGERLTLTGRVTSPGGTPSGTIKFYDGDAVLNAQPAGNGTVSFATADLAEGEHHLSAVFTPGSTAFAPSTSNVVVHVVGPGRRRAARH